MNRGRGKLTERELEEIQDRHRRNWNRMVHAEEAEHRAALAEEPQDRPELRLIEGGIDG